jgi:hypothetical protein
MSKIKISSLEFTHFLSVEVRRTPANKGWGTFLEVVFAGFLEGRDYPS